MTKDLKRTSDLRERMYLIFKSSGRGVLMLRNPYDAIVSWWNHVKSSSGTADTVNSEEVERSMAEGEEFCEFASREANLWRVLALDWITLTRDLFVMFFEDFKSDYEKELRKMLRFLKVPVSEERLACLRKHPIEQYKRKRKKKRSIDFFCPEARKLVQKAVIEVDEALQATYLRSLPQGYY